jgi:hypothetical protein
MPKNIITLGGGQLGGKCVEGWGISQKSRHQKWLAHLLICSLWKMAGRPMREDGVADGLPALFRTFATATYTSGLTDSFLGFNIFMKKNQSWKCCRRISLPIKALLDFLPPKCKLSFWPML